MSGARFVLSVLLATGLSTAALGQQAPIGPAPVATVAPKGATVEICDFAQRPGREFLFPTADPALRAYGFVLWKTQPSVIEDPLDYDSFKGRRGKLTGNTVVRHGVKWYEGVLDDCSPVYAEDASGHSGFEGMQHLELMGRVVFEDMRAAALSIVGWAVYVKGAGLESRQRLYTTERNRSYPLRDGERLVVVGVDAHRYAHAKGVGPFFLQVRRAAGQVGLIKYNPQYLKMKNRDLPLYAAFDPDNPTGATPAPAPQSPGSLAPARALPGPQ